MAYKSKKSNLLSLVPVRTEAPAEQIAYQKTGDRWPCVVADFSFERILDSIKIAESGNTQHAHAGDAHKAMELQHKWENLPVYTHDVHYPKRQLFSNFSRVVNDVYGERKRS